MNPDREKESSCILAFCIMAMVLIVIICSLP